MFYRINDSYNNNCSKCLHTLPEIEGQTIGNSTTNGSHLIDIDTENFLSNRDLIYSRCDEGQLSTINMDKVNKSLKHVEPCGKFLNADSTLLSAPKDHFREIDSTKYHFQYLPQDVQSVVFWDFRIDSRLQSKDSYQQKYPKPIAIEPSLPPTSQPASVVKEPQAQAPKEQAEVPK